MKTFCRFILLLLVMLTFTSGVLHAGDMVSGVVEPFSNERINILTGDKATVSLGEKDGLITGDIGLFGADSNALATDSFLGECAITKTGYTSSICEAVKVNREVEGGHSIFFSHVTFSDPNLYTVAIASLSNIVGPFKPYEKVRVCLYGFFDSSNAVTGLSEDIEKEFKAIFSQKKRIEMVGKDALKNLIFYPKFDKESFMLVKGLMKKAAIDAVVIGEYKESGQDIELTITKLVLTGTDIALTFHLPLTDKYKQAASKVLLTRQDPTRADIFSLNVLMNPAIVQLQREERMGLIKRESGDNPLTEMTLKRLDFNILAPVDTNVRVDDEAVVVNNKQIKDVVLLGKGRRHAVSVSFRRGYFANEALLYASEQLTTKDLFIDVTKRSNLVMEVVINPLIYADPITVKIYDRVERQRQVIQPIYRMETEKSIETFRD
jgi:hypothetical protein